MNKAEEEQQETDLLNKLEKITEASDKLHIGLAALLDSIRVAFNKELNQEIDVLEQEKKDWGLLDHPRINPDNKAMEDLVNIREEMQRRQNSDGGLGKWTTAAAKNESGSQGKGI